MAGIAEEAGFRGYMQSAIEPKCGPVAAIAVVSFIFAAIHFTHGVGSTLPRLPYYLAISVIYGMLTYRTGSILPTLVIHAWRRRTGVPDRLTLGRLASRPSSLAKRSGWGVLARSGPRPSAWHGGQFGPARV